MTFAGSAALQADSSYGVWIGDSSGATGATVNLFDGAASTRAGLPAGYTLATNDIRSFDSGITKSSSVEGYPWIVMLDSTSATSDGGIGPAPEIQQFGKPSSGNCDSSETTNLNWAGVSGGGWDESWAQCMNGGLGGTVCTRTLVYSTSNSKWIVG